ncbi:MAG: cellulase family glycosylhydrolase, partial [Thermoguttaceae bacterium]|nr:cellulase family glycosylhydrolase [Thermoguttaceae bacterium]
MRTTLSIAASAFAALCLAAVPAFAADSDALFPFVVEKGAPASITTVRTWDEPSPAADSDGIFTPKDGKFTADSGPRRLMGTNLCFSGSFPTKEKAERLAATLGRFGIGVVRLHHMDSRDIWGKNAKNSLLEIDPEQLDKLDYLISQFRKHGIYVNINLHVSRKFDERDGFVNSAKLPEHTKGVDNFERRMIEYQKKYAKDLLAHVNPYTKYAYVDDPGVAVIEINNENSVVASWSWGQLDSLPEPYCDEFRAIWNGWLTKKYGSTKKLRAAWGCKDVPLGDNVVAMGDFPADFNFNGPWRIESDDQTKFSWKILGKAETGIDANALRLDVESLGSEFWRPQFHFTTRR